MRPIRIRCQDDVPWGWVFNSIFIRFLDRYRQSIIVLIRKREHHRVDIIFQISRVDCHVVTLNRGSRIFQKTTPYSGTPLESYVQTVNQASQIGSYRLEEIPEIL